MKYKITECLDAFLFIKIVIKLYMTFPYKMIDKPKNCNPTFDMTLRPANL